MAWEILALQNQNIYREPVTVTDSFPPEFSWTRPEPWSLPIKIHLPYTFIFWEGSICHHNSVIWAARVLGMGRWHCNWLIHSPEHYWEIPCACLRFCQRITVCLTIMKRITTGLSRHSFLTNTLGFKWSHNTWMGITWRRNCHGQYEHYQIHNYIHPGTSLSCGTPLLQSSNKLNQQSGAFQQV